MKTEEWKLKNTGWKHNLNKNTFKCLKEIDFLHKLWFPKSIRSNNLSLKYQRFTPSGCIDIGLRKFDFVVKTQFLYVERTIFELRLKFKQRLKFFKFGLRTFNNFAYFGGINTNIIHNLTSKTKSSQAKSKWSLYFTLTKNFSFYSCFK